MSEDRKRLYRDLVRYIDRIFPWYFISLTVYYSLIVTSTIALIVPGGRYPAVIIAMFLFIPMYMGLFPMFMLSRIYRARFIISDFLYDDSADEKELRRNLAMQEYKKTRKNLRMFIMLVFLSFAVLIVMVLFVGLFTLSGSW